jgi:glutamate dehydrogenase
MKTPNRQIEKELGELFDVIKDKLPVGHAESVADFTKVIYANTPRDELVQRDVADLYGATLSGWQFIQEFKGSAKVRVFNPEYEEHGWQSTHTVIELVHPDMPFLVDSVRMEVNRRNFSIHSINHVVFDIERDKNGDMVAAGSLSRKSERAKKESFIYLEVDRHTNNSDLTDLTESLEGILEEIRLSVADFTGMRDQAIQCRMDLENSATQLTSEQLSEGTAFIDWLISNHFTFIAAERFKIVERNNKKFIERENQASLGGFRKYKHGADFYGIDELSPEEQQLFVAPQPVSFSKSGVRSRVHRPAYFDYVIVKRFDENGAVVGGTRFMGLYTSKVYMESPFLIPFVRRKVQAILDATPFERNGHNYKELTRILEVYPREELFLGDKAHLYKTSIDILNIQERRQTRVFLRRDSRSKFISVLVYTPRDLYNTALRRKMDAVLHEFLNPIDVEFTTFFSESILARTHFILRVDPDKDIPVEAGMIERRIKHIVRSWEDDLGAALNEYFGEERGVELYQLYRHGFNTSFRDTFSPRTAVVDIQHLNQLEGGKRVAMSLYRELEEDQSHFKFKLYNADKLLPLSDIIPVLENLGLRVIGEHPYEVLRSDGRKFFIHDFALEYGLDVDVDIHDVKALFQDAFEAVWEEQAENDAFNRMVLGGKLSWREISMLRAYARYMKQIRFGFSEQYIADTLCRYINLSSLLVKLFNVRFSVDVNDEARSRRFEQLEADFIEALDTVEQLNEDKILRRFHELIKATLRTNYFQDDAQGHPKTYFSFKMNPHAISSMPLPRPMFEIFVYSPRVEGVHLRGGRVARGGLRWSDRVEDFRTEVLGLVKAQQVKNAVIVPVGAKGGFIAKQLAKTTDRESFFNEGVACYKIFISALLDITDNLIEGNVVPPVQVMRHDEDDTYLVVAADKGTATFSDIANEIAESRGFWLGDAFASGGSVGYDHKKMGITARGAWVSVQRHFRERGINIQEQDFTVIGVGDMAGDVFGNGMLLSEHIRLVAAFNHMHIFIDPEPDAASTFLERKRLFEMPRSSWDDYDRSLISAGGGIFLRAAKSIPVTPQMKQRFGLTKDKMAPNDLIRAILKSQVDLIWNGGIGTYFKANSETHTDVGDKANDGLRVNGADLNARVVGEGGNLGMTQLARVEFGLKGGASFTDFIDNAGGVDCSDHEVNLKILLNQMMAEGDMTRKQRDKLLAQMTEEVSDLVLKNNYRQTQAISLAYSDAKTHLDEYTRLIRDFEKAGKLDRALEFLPKDSLLAERKVHSLGLTRPELSILISYAKAELKDALNCEMISGDKYLARAIETAFPQTLVDQFKEPLYGHRLRSEIVATQLANDVVNRMGITFVNRLKDSTGARVTDILKAYVAARDVFKIDSYWARIEALDYKIPTAIQEEMMAGFMRLLRRSARWFLKNRRGGLDVAKEVEHFSKRADKIGHILKDMLHGRAQQIWQERYDRYVSAGVPDELATVSAATHSLFSALSIIEAADQAGKNIETVARSYYALGNHLELDWFMEQVNNLATANHWQALARESFRDDLDWQQRTLTESVILRQGELDTQACLDAWVEEYQDLVSRWKQIQGELRDAEELEFAMFAVALRELMDLAQASMSQSSAA